MPKLRGSSFFSKCFKFDVDSRNLVKYPEKGFTFLDHYILIGCCKFWLLQREYLSSAAKILTKSPKGYNITKRDSFCISPLRVTKQDNKSALMHN